MGEELICEVHGIPYGGRCLLCKPEPDENENEKDSKLDDLLRAARGARGTVRLDDERAYESRPNPSARETQVPAGVIDFGKVMRARRAAEAEARALDDADALLAKMQQQMHRMQTMLVALVKRDGRMRITRREIEETEAAREKLQVRIDPETGTVTLEVMT